MTLYNKTYHYIKNMRHVKKTRQQNFKRKLLMEIVYVPIMTSHSLHVLFILIYTIIYEVAFILLDIF